MGDGEDKRKMRYRERFETKERRGEKRTTRDEFADEIREEESRRGKEEKRR